MKNLNKKITRTKKCYVPNTLPKLDFNITNRCNFRCIHCCFRSGEILLDEFSLEKIAIILKEFKELGGQRFDITGGEPLLRKDIFEIIKLGKKLGLEMELVTNGSLLSKNKLIQLKRAGLLNIAISMDGSKYKIYKKIRPVNLKTYKKIVSNIQTARNLGIYTKINTVIFNSNFSDLENITKKCIKWKANEQGFYFFSPVGRGALHPEEAVEPERWLNLLRTRISKHRHKIKLSLESPVLEKGLTKNLNTSCYLKNPWHLQILPDGNVYPCAIMAFRNKPCGNLYSQTLKEVWYNKKLWNGSYYKKAVKPLINKYGCCVDYKSFKEKLKDNNWSFLCLMCKFKAHDFLRSNHEN